MQSGSRDDITNYDVVRTFRKFRWDANEVSPRLEAEGGGEGTILHPHAQKEFKFQAKTVEIYSSRGYFQSLKITVIILQWIRCLRETTTWRNDDITNCLMTSEINPPLDMITRLVITRGNRESTEASIWWTGNDLNRRNPTSYRSEFSKPAVPSRLRNVRAAEWSQEEEQSSRFGKQQVSALAFLLAHTVSEHHPASYHFVAKDWRVWSSRTSKQ